MIRTLYLAGPDVFRPDAAARGEALKALCREFGFEGLFPLDQALPVQIADPAAQARSIYEVVPTPLVVGDARRALARLREDLGVDV